jgi:hypothetical protein
MSRTRSRAALRFLFGALLIVANATSGAAFGAESVSYVHVPGAFVRSDCVYAVPQGSTIEGNGDITRQGVVIGHPSDCPQPAIVRGQPSNGTEATGSFPGNLNGGWVMDEQNFLSLPANDNIDSISAEWPVPSNPAAMDSAVTTFLWIGTQTTNCGNPGATCALVQPVLQWGQGCGFPVQGGPKTCFGGEEWGATTWIIMPNGNAIFNDAIISASTNQDMYGYVEVTSQSGSSMELQVSITNEHTGSSNGINWGVSGLQFSQAFGGVLEVDELPEECGSGENACAFLPVGGEDFFQVQLYHGVYPNFIQVTNGWTAIYDANGPNPWDYAGTNCGWYMQNTLSNGVGSNQLGWSTTTCSSP